LYGGVVQSTRQLNWIFWSKGRLQYGSLWRKETLPSPPGAAVEAAEQGGKIRAGQTRWQALLEVSSLIFVAEWGDRSMLATIALGAAQSPFGEQPAVAVRGYCWRSMAGRGGNMGEC
jgi:hypothetical protein